MSDKTNERGKRDGPPQKGSTFMRNLFYIALLALVVLGFLAYLSFNPQDLEDIAGYRDEPDVIAPAPPDLMAMLEEVAKSDRAVTITEHQLNLFLRGTLRFKQEGMLKDFIEAKGVWVRLEDGRAEVILEREINGKRRHTVSMYLSPEQVLDEEGVLHTKVHRTRGRWGRTNVFRGFLLLTSSSFKSLAGAYSKELKQLERLFESKVTITIANDEITLDPAK